MSVPGPWEDVAPGTEYRPGVPTSPGANGRVLEPVATTTPEYTVFQSGGGRVLQLGLDANGNPVTLPSNDRLADGVEGFRYSSRVFNATGPGGLFYSALRQMVPRQAIGQSPTVLLGVPTPPDAIGWEWEDDAWLDYELNFGPWTPARDDIVQPTVQGGGAYGDTDVTPPTGFPDIETNPATFTFKGAVIPGSAMTLEPSTSVGTLIGTGPSLINLPGTTQTFSIPSRGPSNDSPDVPFNPAPMRFSPGADDWLVIGVYADWWPNAYADDPYQHTARAGYTYVTFPIYRDPWPRYRWLYPSPPSENRYGWGVLLG